MFKDCTVFVALCALPCAIGQNKPMVLKAARMFDGNRMVTPGVVVVSGSKILAVGADAVSPSGAEVMDFGDATLSPGFMDAHTHLSMMSTDDYRQAMLDGLQKTVAERALLATANLRKTLMAGVTTARDVGSSDFIDVGLRNAVRAGSIVGPRMLVAVHAIGATGGHCDETGFREGALGKESGPEDGVVNGADQARRAVRLAHKYGATVIKTCATGGVLSLADAVDTPQESQRRKRGATS